MTDPQASAWTRKFYPRGDGVAFDRVVFFTDAVYAIALTLVAVEIGLPEVPAGDSGSAALWSAITAKGPALWAFGVAFLWVAIYWRANHRFVQTLRAMNSSYVLATLGYLALVALLPFPAAILGEYGNEPVAVTVLAVYVAVVSGFEVVLFVIADRGDLFRAPLSPGFRMNQLIGSLSPVFVFLSSIPLAFLLSPVAAGIYWLVASVIIGRLVARRWPEPPPADLD